MISRAIPTINTSRLTLRALGPQDFARFAEIWTMQDVVRYIGGASRSKAASWGAFLRNAGQWQITGFGQWGIEERGTKRLIGQVGFFHGCRELGDDFDVGPEAGWILTPDVHGQGYGMEATSAAHEWFDRVITGPLVCQLAPENQASAQLSAHLGYVPLRLTTFEGHPSQLMIRQKPPQPK